MTIKTTDSNIKVINPKPREIDDFSDFAGLVGQYDKQQLSVVSWHPGSDKGGGIFYWDGSQAKSGHNGGTIISPTVPWTTTTADFLNGVGETDAGGNGCWVRLYDGAVNAMWFGAKANGVADDTASAQSAFNVGAAAVYFPDGSYLCSKLSALSSSPAGLTIFGDGKNRSLILSSESGDQSINISAASNASGVTLRDIAIDGNNQATTVYFYRHTNLVLDSVRIVKHIENNCHIERAYQVSIRSSVLTVDLADGANCALYLATNGVTIDSECYFNTQQSAPAILVNENEFGDCFGIVVTNNVFENSSLAMQMTENINTSGIIFDDNYLEMVQPTTAKGVQFNGGRHENVSIKGNHIAEVVTPVEILAVDPASHFDIKNNRLYRPIVIATTVGDAAKMAAFDMPGLNIENQEVKFENATYTFDLAPVVIVDQNFAFSSLFVEKIDVPGLNNAYNRIQARSYYRSASNSATNLLTFYLPSSGGTVQAYSIAGSVSLMWRRGPQSLTGSSSVHADRHKIEFAARNTGTATVGQNIVTVSTTTPVSSAQIVVSGAGQTMSFEGTGESSIDPNEWVVDFDLSYLR